MNVRLALVSLVVGTSLLLPVTALAHRPATSSETKAIRAAIAAYIKKPSNHAASDNKVTSALVSTVDSHYAAAKLKSISGNSTALLKLSGKVWKVIGFGPGQKCSLASKAIRKDLSIVCGSG
jgi:hypothetical protein